MANLKTESEVNDGLRYYSLNQVGYFSIEI